MIASCYYHLKKTDNYKIILEQIKNLSGNLTNFELKRLGQLTLL